MQNFKENADLLTTTILRQQSILQELAKLLKPRLDLLQRIIVENKSIFDNFALETLAIQKKEYLLQNGWILTPYLRNKTIEEQLSSDDLFKRKNSELNTIYEIFFSQNNYSELLGIIESWAGNKVFAKRISIFHDCLVILQTFRSKRSNTKINPSRVILPLLIAQIDGITSEYAKIKGLSLDGTQWKDGSGDDIQKFKSIWDQPYTDKFGTCTIRMLQEYLFSKVYPYGQINPAQKNEIPKKVKFRPFFQFSRHKIIHGEDLKYGTIDNVIRAFLLLDFLAHLK